MSSDQSNSVLRQKARATRDEQRARDMSPAKALRRALSRTATAIWELALETGEIRETSSALADLEGRFGSGGLFVLLEGEEGRRGAAWLDMQLVSALIEVQTTGSVTRRQAQERPLTRTDAAIVAPLIDGMLERYEQQMAECRDALPASFRFGVMIEDARTLCLALEAPEFHQTSFQVDIADGAKTGTLEIVLPLGWDSSQEAREPDPEVEGAALAETVLRAPARLDSVLDRVRMPLQRVCRLAVGDLVPLSAERMELRLESTQKHLVAKARLGRLNGMRAVRLLGDGRVETGFPASSSSLADKPDRADAASPGGAISSAWGAHGQPAPVKEPVAPPRNGERPADDAEDGPGRTGVEQPAKLQQDA